MQDIEIIEGHDNDHARKISDDLSRHNESLGHPSNKSNYTMVIKDGDDVLGGAVFNAEWDYIAVQYLYVEQKEKGVGRQIMQAIEQFAIKNKKVGIYLTTSEYQAPDFYTKLGYIETGRIPRYVNGYDEILMVKIV